MQGSTSLKACFLSPSVLKAPYLLSFIITLMAYHNQLEYQMLAEMQEIHLTVLTYFKLPIDLPDPMSSQNQHL